MLARMPSGKQVVPSSATLLAWLREKASYWLFLSLLVAAGTWGLIRFRAPDDGLVAEIPVTPGDELGIYVTGRTPSLETIVEASQSDSLFQPFNLKTDVFTGSSKIHAWIRLPLTNPDNDERTYVLQLNYQWD